MTLHNPFHLDLALLHAPSVYDFRSMLMLQGPIADVIPSTDEFEMYPVGLTSIAAYLERNNYNVRIVNLANRMLRDRRYDVVAHLRRLHATIFGIDLHWLPHAQGALAIAELAKQVHPEAYVLIGGLSASYYHEELIANPAVDFVLRGDSTEEPCRQLLQALREGTPLERVENLTWKRADGEAVVNPLTFVPANLDYVDAPAYQYILDSVVKYRRPADALPYLEWLRYPTTMILNARGCLLDCAICGGSRTAYRNICQRPFPAFRSPEKLVADIRTIASFSRAPIFMVHDPRMGGSRRAQRFFDLLRTQRVRNELIFELFYPADDAFFTLIERSVASWSLEMTIETPDERLRRANGKFACSNAQIEATIASALAHGCHKLDLFFMTGLPHQTYADATQVVDYCEALIQRFGADPRLQFFNAPLAPFLDPGSRAFENPALGYQVADRTLAGHSQALLQPSWKATLSYETDAMTREEIVAASYEVARRLNELKLRHGLIERTTHDAVQRHLRAAQFAMQTVDAIGGVAADAQQTRYERMRHDLAAANTASLCGEDELKWGLMGRFRLSYTLLRSLARGSALELGRTIQRMEGRYDTAITQVARRTTWSERHATPQAPVRVEERDAVTV